MLGRRRETEHEENGSEEVRYYGREEQALARHLGLKWDLEGASTLR